MIAPTTAGPGRRVRTLWTGASRTARIATVGAAASVVAVGGVAWATGASTGSAPEPSSSPSASATTSASATLAATPTAASEPTPSTTPTPIPAFHAFAGGVAPGEVTVHPTLPDALPLPDGIWAETGPGWVLAVFQPTGSESEEPQVVYLASPQGERYQVLELDPSGIVTLDSWVGGEARALVRGCPEDSCLDPGRESGTKLLDLSTGEAETYPLPFDGGRVIATLPDRVRLWWSEDEEETYVDRDGDFVALKHGWEVETFRVSDLADVVSPDGEWLAVTWHRPRQAGIPHYVGVASITTGEVTEFLGLDDHYCVPVNWVDDVTLRVRCDAPDHSGLSLFFDANRTTAATTEVLEPLRPVNPTGTVEGPVAPDVWVTTDVWSEGPGENYVVGTNVSMSDHGTITPLVIVDESGEPLPYATLERWNDDYLYFLGCDVVPAYTNPSLFTLVAYNLDSGTQAVLVPEPTGQWTLSDGSLVDWRSGLDSWVVAP